MLPVFSRKPLFGYPLVVFSGVAIGFVGWGVWAHHMFASGLGPISVAVFSVATMAIAIPTGVKIVNWTMTMWGGKLWFTTAMLFAIGLIVQFTIGGLSGVTHAVAPSDTQQTDTYYIVAHFHYVLFGGAVLGFFAGLYYWWPKMFGKMLSEKIGKWNFWLMVIGMNLTFGPMHIIGLQGQPRRMYITTEAARRRGLLQPQLLEPGVVDRCVRPRHRRAAVRRQRDRHRTRKPEKAPLDPWDARSLEWLTTSPPKEHNFDEIPTVHHLDEFFHRKYEDRGEGEHHDFHKVATAEELLAEQEANADAHIHMPSPSYWPLLLAFGLPVMAYGVIFSRWLIPVGAAIVLLVDLRLGAWSRPRRPTPTSIRPPPRAAPSWRSPPMADAAIDTVTGGRRSPITAPTTPRPACPTTSWRCGCSSGPSACCSVA